MAQKQVEQNQDSGYSEFNDAVVATAIAHSTNVSI